MHSGAPSNSYVPSSLSQNRFPSIPYRDQVAGASGVSPSAPPQVAFTTECLRFMNSLIEVFFFFPCKAASFILLL